MEKLIQKQVEFLPLLHDHDRYFALHILTVLNAINYETAQLRRLDTGLVVGFEKYEFFNEVVKDQHIFKVFLEQKYIWYFHICF
ncbi:hypothetical protein [Brevibacillus laterosporus]|uniref:hypothetical protein n=1 Tax=Brevibacillus laterosporus TaxID=1465 RepID=UPI002E24607B